MGAVCKCEKNSNYQFWRFFIGFKGSWKKLFKSLPTSSCQD